MPLDPTKLNDIILAHASSHDSDNCEFCEFINKLPACTRLIANIVESADLMVLSADNSTQYFFDAFIAGIICGVKLERVRVMEEEFKL
jgi:hypothetical protein